MQFFYDHADSSLEFRDIRCPSARTCVAAGVIAEKNGHDRGVVVLTSDGGQHWSQIEVRERPVSLFFLNDSLGWMATDHGIWMTQESGRTWNKLESLKDLERVYFLDPSHGYAIGSPKAVYETTDGGKKWSKLAAAEHAPGEPRETVYHAITFSGEHGVILGSIDQSETAPLRINPATGLLETKPADDTVLLETVDGGRNWTTKGIRLDGRLTQLNLTGGKLILVVQYQARHQFPSAVFETPLGSAESQMIFAKRDRVVLDLGLFKDGGGVVVAVEPPGKSNLVPIPGKLKILSSPDLKNWQEMDVDYRAIAQQAALAAPDAQHLWVTTDTGMILHWQSGGASAH